MQDQPLDVHATVDAITDVGLATTSEVAATDTGGTADLSSTSAPDGSHDDAGLAKAPDAVTSDADIGKTPDAMPAQKTLVTVTFEGAVIGPAKRDGKAWDSDVMVSPSNIAAITTALGAPNSYNDVIAILSNAALAGFQAPDPFGDVWIDGPGIQRGMQPLATEAEYMKDTYTPTFSRRPAWTGIPLDRDIRFTVQLTDSDLIYNDAIAPVSINMDDLKKALDAKQIYHVRVSDQSFNELLFVNISVVATK